MEIITKNRKGIMLTLATVVLFVLMLAELVAYVTLNINYNVLVSSSSSVSGGASAIATLNSAASVFLHQSLQNALNSLIRYESTPTMRNGNFINNTTYALQSLMSTGMIYGTSMQSYMGGSILNGFISAMNNQIYSQGMNVIITNGTLTVFQNSPFTISANYSALVVVNSSRGLYTFPLAATSSVSLNGTQSLYGIEAGDPFIIKPMPSYPKAVLIGGNVATSGSATTTLFSYGTAFYISGTPTCSSVPSQYQNGNYILVTPSAASISSTVCGMGGLVTYTANSPASTVPYLVYQSSSNIVNAIQSGTSILLSVTGLSLLNVSSLQSAIQNGYSFASPYVPSYLDWAQGSLTQRSRNGMFSFNLLNRQIASFGGGSSYINAGNGASLNLISFTIGLWIKTSQTPSGEAEIVSKILPPKYNFDIQLLPTGQIQTQTYDGVTNPYGTSSSSYNDGKWHYIVAIRNTVAQKLYLYMDGISVNSVTDILGDITNTDPLYIGSYRGSAYYFNGLITDVQIYNTALAPEQVMQLYQEGIDSIPISGSGLIGWWPLNGDFHDYSGKNNNGTATSVIATRLNDYQADPIWGGSLYTTNALNANALNITEGVMNCGTAAQCYNPALGHLYLANVPLTGTYSNALSESAALGLLNSILPP